MDSIYLCIIHPDGKLDLEGGHRGKNDAVKFENRGARYLSRPFYPTLEYYTVVQLMILTLTAELYFDLLVAIFKGEKKFVVP